LKTDVPAMKMSGKYKPARRVPGQTGQILITADRNR
jgi:hypothetical protein